MASGTVTLGNGDRNLIAGGIKAPVHQFINGTGFRDRVVRFRATVAAANVALNTLVYATVPHYYGVDSLTVTVWDLGNTGTLAQGPVSTGSNATSTAPTVLCAPTTQHALLTSVSCASHCTTFGVSSSV